VSAKGGPITSGTLPEFDNPPVVEVALGVQFRPIFGLRPIELALLRDRWRSAYPLVQEQPPLPATIESTAVGAPQIQLVLGPALQTRLWFLTQDQTELIQLQHDRLTVNWRAMTPGDTYPRYEAVRGVFERRFADLTAFIAERALGDLFVVQAEVNYVNAVRVAPLHVGQLGEVLEHWRSMEEHHLGAASQARASMVFEVPDIGSPPVRLYVAVDPAQRPDGQNVLFVTLTIRGAPSDHDLGGALDFMDHAHGHIVNSFVELTPATRHQEWGLHR
jgi:uncharacterized protein (TIGR04255 family)